MKKRLLSLLLCLALLLSIAPAVSATEAIPEVPQEISQPTENVLPANTIAVGGVVLRNGDYLASNASAAVRTKPSGGYAYWNNGVLTLHNYRYSGVGYIYQGVSAKCSSVIYAENGFTLRLEGTNNLTNTKAGSDGITLESNANVTINGGGTLQINADYGIFTTYSGNLILDNVTLNIQSDGFGIYCNRNITATNSRLKIASNDTGIYCFNLTLTDTSVQCLTPNYGIVCDGALNLSHDLQVLYPVGGKVQPLTSAGGYTRSTVTDKHNRAAAVCAIGTPFADVRTGAYYDDAVYFAVAAGITDGVSATTFAPDKTCTRAEAVTFLWRAFGCPEASGEVPCYFTDVNPKAYYYDAMLTAVSSGVTNGMTPTTFAPNAPCTRAQIVTFLYRAVDEPEPTNHTSPFTDVNANAYYYEAMLWAVEEGLVKGMTPTTFAPNAPCTRAQIVTLLYRLAK